MKERAGKIAIIIPAYNESKNIVTLLQRIFVVWPSARVIIIDDSPPEQQEVLRHMQAGRKQKVQVFFRGRKLGRGSAVLVGFRLALKDTHIEYFFEMDADLSHDPADCKQLLTKIHDADLVIGSRYLRGSNVYKWPRRRLIASKIINYVLNIWLGLHLSDYTNGFRVYRRVAVSFLMTQQMNETGFMALSEMAYKVKKAGFRLAEVPVSFTDRTYGVSSATFREHLHALFGALRIRLAHNHD